MVRKKTKNLATEALKVGTYKTWSPDGNNWHSSLMTHICPHCGAGAVHRLPGDIRKVQPNDTTHVCNPAFGGCNQGFAFDEMLPVVSEGSGK